MHSAVKGANLPSLLTVASSYVIEPWIPLVPWLPEVAQGRRCSNPAIDIAWSIYKVSFIQIFFFRNLIMSDASSPAFGTPSTVQARRTDPSAP